MNPLLANRNVILVNMKNRIILLVENLREFARPALNFTNQSDYKLVLRYIRVTQLELLSGCFMFYENHVKRCTWSSPSNSRVYMFYFFLFYSNSRSVNTYINMVLAKTRQAQNVLDFGQYLLLQISQEMNVSYWERKFP